MIKIFDASISQQVQAFLENRFNSRTTLTKANQVINAISGINNFFETQEELDELKAKLFLPHNIDEGPDRTEYGDFQTNTQLALNVSRYLSERIKPPEILIEPTCGKGNFIIASLQTFTSLTHVYGVEIYKPYVWETKFSILEFFLNNPSSNKPEIHISHFNVFDFDFGTIAANSNEKNVLVIGNPPWVTNSMLGALNSANLPAKSNFKKHSGLDAMTGKGNFDIAEYITLMMLDIFHNINGHLALLVKNSVIKNIVFDQKNINYSIQNLKKLCIDSKKEFGVSVDAAMFFCQFNSRPAYDCKEFNFYSMNQPVLEFGWVDDKFVSNITEYIHSKQIDGICPFEWRQGLKHDCSAIMELERTDKRYSNAKGELVQLEDQLLYGLLKSSDLKNTVVKTARKYTIVTQKKVGQDTAYIRKDFPKTYNYLQSHKHIFDNRKSSIYKGKPPFSIFGIGDYSFKPYKVTISGFYKTSHFTLVLPENGKPLMLDDTCYMLGFDSLDYAVYTLILLNSTTTANLLASITFPDAKRTFTKDVLMRIDLYQLSQEFSIEKVNEELETINSNYGLNAVADGWFSFIRQITPFQNAETLAVV